MQAEAIPRANGLSVKITERVDEDEWDERVESVDEGSYRQTTMFARHQDEYCYEKALFFEAVDGDGQAVGQLSTRIGAPFTWGIRRRPLSGIALPLLGALAPFMNWGDGPVIFALVNRKEVYETLLRAAVGEARRRGCISIEAWPAFYGDGHEAEREWIRKLYIDCDFQVATSSTLVVDLRKDEEELWRGVRKEARTKVRKARTQGVEIIELDGDEELLVQAHRILQETATRNRVACLTQAMMRQALQYHGSHGVLRAFIAFHEGKGVAYQNVTCFNRNAQLGGVAYSEYSRQERIYGNDLMQWHVMEAVRESGVEWLDYGGAAPDSQDPKVQGIYKFKAKWGGDLIRCDRFRLINPGRGRFSARGIMGRMYEKAGGGVYGAA